MSCFLATPHEFSRELVPEAISHGFRVIDLSGAWRLKQAANRKVYGFAECASQLDEAAVYGLPELHADAIKHAALLANPGCYSTSIILALAPWIRAGFVDLQHGIVCDSKSGVSGAGKQPTSTDALRGSGRRLLRLQRFWAPAHGRDAGAARTREPLACNSRRICCRFRAASFPPST